MSDFKFKISGMGKINKNIRDVSRVHTWEIIKNEVFFHITGETGLRRATDYPASSVMGQYLRELDRDVRKENFGEFSGIPGEPTA